MADEEYQKKLRDLEKYVPFLENTIKRLKTETGKPREAQISKLQSLLVILTNTRKKLKYDALKKCEEVILKLYDKVEKKPTGEIMHKYMCRNPPEDKFIFDIKSSSPMADNEVAFSVARQKLNKQAEMTPASPSPPLVPDVVAPKPVVIPTEKVPVEDTRAADAFFTPIVNNEFNQPQPSIYQNETWSNFQEMVPPNPQTINWPTTVFNQPVNPVINHQINHFPQETPIIQPFFQPPNPWPVVNAEPLYLRRNDLNRPNGDAKYDVWKNQNMSRKQNTKNRELIDYSDSFGVDNSPTIDDIPVPVPPPIPVPPPKKPTEILPKKEETIVKPELPKKELIKITFPPKPDLKKIAAPIVTSLNKPPLTESDLQDLLSSSTASPNSGEASPLVNDDMDLEKLEELKEKLCKELEESKKKDQQTTKSTSSKSSTSSSTSSQPPKPKSPRIIERVVKEQDNIFGNLLSSIDEQIIVKAKEQHKKPEKKEVAVKKDENNSKKEKKNHSTHKKDDVKSDKSKDKDRHKDKDNKSKDKEKKKDDVKDKTISKSEVNKLNEKVKSSYFKDDKKDEQKTKSKDDTGKEHSKPDSKHHKKEDSSSSKPKEDSKHKSKDSKSKELKSNSSSKSKTDKDHSKDDKSSSKDREDKSRRSSITKDHQKSENIKQKVEDIKQNIEDLKKVELPKPKIELSKPQQTIEKITPKVDELKQDLEEPKNKMPIVDKIMKDLKASVQEKKEENLSKFGDIVREMQVNLLKSDSNHSITSDSSKDSKQSQNNDDKISNSGRLSDKYPHKRKPSLDRAEPSKTESTESFIPPKSKALTTEIHPSKLADPRLLRHGPNLMSPPLPPSLSPEKNYQSPQFNNEPSPQMNMFPFNPQQIRNNFPNQNMFPNESRPSSIERFSPGNMSMAGNKTPIDSFTNMDGYSNNMGNRTPGDPFLNDQYNNMGGMTPSDPFSSNFDVDMRDSNRLHSNMPFSNNFGGQMPINQNSDQFWNRSNQEQYMNQFDNEFQNQRFQNFGRFSQNQNIPPQRQHNFQNYDYEDQSSFSPYDLSQMNPIDFYDTEGRGEDRRQPPLLERPPSLLELDFNSPNQGISDFHQQNHNNHEFNAQNQMGREFPPQNNRDFNPQTSNNRSFRGRGLSVSPRGNFRGRGHSRNIQWVNPTIRDEVNRREDQNSEDYQRKSQLGRFPTDRSRFPVDETPKDPRRSRFSTEDIRQTRYSSEERKSESRSRFSNEENRSNSRTRPSRFSSDDSKDSKDDSGRNYTSRFEDVSKRDDPRKRSYDKKPEETTDKTSSKDSNEPSKKKDEIFSPLNSLYALDTKTQVGKGYGIQKFKIPKIRRSVDENKDEKETKKEEEKSKETVESVKIEDVKETELEPEKIVEEINKTVEETKKVEDIVKIEENKKLDEAEVKIEANTSSSTTEEITGEASTKTEADEKLDMFNKFMKHIFDTCDSSVLLQYLDKCGFSLPQAKTKRIRRIIESDSESEDDETKEEKQEEVPEQEEFKQPEQKTPEKKSPKVETGHISEEEAENDVIESVGERIKNRRRKQLIYSSDSSPEKSLIRTEESLKTPPKKVKNVPKTRRKNALELLQDDLREMFISEGVLTATGKRMCRMMKEHQESGGLYSEISPKKSKNKDLVTTTTDEDDDIPLARRKFGPKFTKKLQKPQQDLKPEEPIKKLPLRKTRSSPRVLLEKINLPTNKSSSETSENESEVEPEPEIKEPKAELKEDTNKSRRTKQVDSSDSVVLESSETTPAKTVTTTKKRRRGRRRRGRRRRKQNVNKDETNNKSDDESIVSEISTKLSEEISEKQQEPEVEMEMEPEPPEKKKSMGKKKKNNWAHGVIKRGRKMRISEKIVSPSVTDHLSDQFSVTGSLNDEPEPEDEPLEIETNPGEIESTAQNSDNEEYPLLKIDIKPDVNYYLDNGNKFDCKLCDYKGKLIVPHYRTRHPESENMISRLSPEQSEKAKIESKLNKFEAISPFDEIIKGKKRRTTYVCRFCTLAFKQEFTSSFFDHICCHTGEYRYSCENCSFLTGVKKTLSAHCHNHPEIKRPLNIVPLWPAPPNFRLVFGYLCKACNFTQLLKPNLEKHVKLSHPGVNIEIIKISMSSKPVNLDDLYHPETSEILTNPKTLELAEEIETVKIKTPESIKEPDMTAFLEPDDMPLREQLIEDERLKKMEEISSNITPRRSTLQFVDQLKNKLQSVLSNSDSFDDDDGNDIDDPEANIDIENHPIEDAIGALDADLNMELEDIIPEELTIKIASTCSLAGMKTSENETELEDSQNSVEEEFDHDEEEDVEPHHSDNEMDISNVELSLPIGSKQKGVLDTIQRLAAKLQTPKSSLPPENLTDQSEFEVTSQDNLEMPVEKQVVSQIINVGAIEVIIKNTEQQYICLVPNCSFTSLYKISFTKHCSDNHQKLLVHCDICQKDGITLKPFTMTALFVHLFDKHKENSKNNSDDTLQAPKIRLRRISGDLLSKPTILEPIKIENIVEPLLEALSQPYIFQPLDEPCLEPLALSKIIEPRKPPLGFLQIKDVRTLTPEEENNLQPSTSVQVTNVTAVTTVTTSTGKKILQTKKMLVPAKELPKYFTVKKNPNAVTYRTVNKKPVVYEKEILSCNKTKKIFNEMLRSLKITDLYKCPIELCSYSTNVKLDFSTHFTNHRWCQITNCVYCHEGITSNNIIPHIDKYHSHCIFQCGFCFYRSISKTYLLIHQQSAHGHQYDSLIPNLYNNVPKYYMLKPATTMFPYSSVNDFLVNSRQSMVPQYQCLQCSNPATFLIADDFMVHLHVFHKKHFECALCQEKSVFFLTAKALIAHYVHHLIGRFQCRFCLFGSMNLAMMYSHYARKHPAMRPICYARQFKDKNLPHNSYNDLIEIDIEKKMYFEKSADIPTTTEPQNLPELVPIAATCSSPTITTIMTVAEPVIDQNSSSSSTEDLKPIIVDNMPLHKDLVHQIQKTNQVIDVIDLSDDYPQNVVQNQSSSSLTNDELNEPLVTLKHRSVESKNAVENAIDPLSVECDFQNVNIETFNFSELIPTSQSDDDDGDDSLATIITEKLLDDSLIPPLTEKILDSDSLDNIVEPIVTELSGNDLFKCGNPECRYKTSKISDFKIHLFTCDIMGENLGYKCFHCNEIYNTVTGLCEHIQLHGIKRFHCELCDFKSPLSRLIVQHMKTKHKIDYTKFEPLINTKKDMSKDSFIVKPILKNKNISIPILDSDEHLLTISSKKISIFESAKNKKAPETNQTTIIESPQMLPQKIVEKMFGPEDMDLLPRPPVYSSEIKCKLCNYNTKVRSNMQRHLQQHIDEKAVSETAPINPVPCLEKNEKMFDKMSNLAASSHYGRMGGNNVEKPDKNVKEDDANYPGFVPTNKRFVCGAENCNYLTHGDTMLRHHLTALHADETSYKCPHCQIDIPCYVDGLEIDQILFHIKMHDLRLYKCPNCDFFHYQKHKMERHLLENHPEMGKSNFQIIRELDNSANLDDSRHSLPHTSSLIEQTNNADSDLEFKPWRCGFCSYKTTGRTDIQNHCFNIHSSKSQFKCGLCNFRCSAKINYGAHYKKNHPNMEINMISVYYKIEEEESKKTVPQDEFQSFDTTPLWVKNKSGVKHIRGILLEESKAINSNSSNKCTPKIIEKLAELKTGEGTSKNVEDITKNLFFDVKSEKETKKASKESKKSLDLAPKYPGHFGAPDGFFYVCPTCEKFKTKSVKDFIEHLHTEMNYFRCACQLCNFRFMDISQAKIHWLVNHKTDGKEEKITPLMPDVKVENWVDNCIRYQHKKMKNPEELKDYVDTDILESTVNISPKKSLPVDQNQEIDVGNEEPKNTKKPKILQPEIQQTPEKTIAEEPIEVSPSKLQCQHCGFIAKTPQTYRKHTKRHFTFKPLKCNNCTFTTFNFISMQQHHRAKHRELELCYTEVPQPDKPVIRPLKRKRSTHQNDVESPVPDETTTETTTKSSVDTSTTTTESETANDKQEKSEFDIIYVCFHCPRKSADLEVVRLHFISSHDKIQKDYFKYKKITIDKNKKTQYKCNYCTWFGHPDGLKQHHLDNHSDKTWICQKAIKYKCTTCQKIFPKIQTLKKHFSSAHQKENLSFQTVFEDNKNESLDTTEIIEVPLDAKPDVKINKCEYCFDRFENAEQLLCHHNLLHSHLELKTKQNEAQNFDEFKKYKCPQCGHTSNSYPAMRDHLRSHNKPYCCTYCTMYFSYPNQLKSHHLKEHRVLPLGEIKEQPDMKRLMDKLRENMLFLEPDGTYSTKKPNLKRDTTAETTDEPPLKVFIVDASSNSDISDIQSTSASPKKINVARKSTSLSAVCKNVARKSTSNRPLKPEGYSFYGSKACDINDYKNVMSEINIMGKIMSINVVAMSHVLNLFPTVPLTDFKKIQNPENL